MRNKFLVVIIIISGIIFYFSGCITSIKRLHHTMHLFDEANIVENFRTFDQVFPTKELKQAPSPRSYPKGDALSLPSEFTFQNQKISTEQFLKRSATTGLIVIQNDSLVYEKYFLGNTAETKNISWSVAKSFISALFGIAIEEGHIKSIEETVETYVPQLMGSAYEGVRIKDVLQMSTGVKFNEDYGDFNSDINRWGRGFALGKSQNAFAASLTREREPGTVNHYVSINTHVLGMILTNATGKSITEYMQEKFWTPMGMEHDGYWVTDNTGMEVALGGLNITLRDYAKIGSLYLNAGKWNGQQIVSSDWVKSSVTPDAPHLMPTKHGLGYGYQWWIPYSTEGEFMAQGVYNQNIYVNPTTKTVIVKLSANSKFTDANYIESRTDVALSLFRAIAEGNSNGF